MSRQHSASVAGGRPAIGRNARFRTSRCDWHLPLIGAIFGGIAMIAAGLAVWDTQLGVVMTLVRDMAVFPWRRPSVIIAIGVLGAAAGFLILFRILAVQFGRIEQSEARFRDYALTSSDWFWETDEHHRFTYLSDGIRSFGHDPEHCIGRSRVDFAADAEGEAAKWQEHFATLERHEPFRDFVYTRKIDEQVAYTGAISGNPFFDPSGRFLGYRGTARDITKQVLAERGLRDAKDAAETANRVKSQFLANISHELRTPLNAIIGFSEMLGSGMAGPLDPRQAEYAKLVHESGQHLLNVINDILDLARADAGKFELHEEPGVDPGSVIGACVALMRDRASAGALCLSTEIAEPLPLLAADPTRLKQILLNLISNAIKFTEPGGSVVIAAGPAADGGVVFEVRDTGSGMTPDETEMALEPFVQVEADHARRYEGTGLGLPLARRLAELHGGALSIDSEKGRGTTAIVTLPASRVAGGGATPPIAKLSPAL